MSTARDTVLPGLGLTLGFSISYLSLLVLIPLSALLFRTASLSPADLAAAVASPRALAAYRLSFGASAAAAAVNAGFGPFNCFEASTRSSFVAERQRA